MPLNAPSPPPSAGAGQWEGPAPILLLSIVNICNGVGVAGGVVLQVVLVGVVVVGHHVSDTLPAKWPFYAHIYFERATHIQRQLLPAQ